MNPTKLILVMALGPLNYLTAQDAKSFSLQEAQDYAAQHNHQLQMAKLDVDIARSKVTETTAIGLPQINGNIDYSHFIDIPTQVIPASAFGGQEGTYIPARFGLPQSATVGFTASQLIFDGSYIVGLQAAKQYVRSAELDQIQSETDIKNSVAQTYISALAAMENVRALKDNETNIEQVYKETKALFEAGFLEQQDADQVKLMRSNIHNQLQFADRQLSNLLELLKFQLGMAGDQTITLTDNIETLIEQQTSTGLALLDQPFTPGKTIEFQRLEQGISLNELQVKNMQAKNLPQLSAFFSHSQNAFREEFDFFGDKKWYPTTLVGFRVSVPIFSSSYRYYGTKQAKLNLARLQLQKDQLEQSLYMQATTARNQYNSTLERYETVKEDLDLARSIKDKTRTKFNAGMASSTELTTAEAQYLTTLGIYINSTLDLLNAKLALDKALGNY